SRTPKMNETDLNHLLQKAKERGYDTKKLIWVKQSE
nr:lipocalin family protein [Bacteroidaceae bacterium]